MHEIIYSSAIKMPMRISSEQSLSSNWRAASARRKKQKREVTEALDLLVAQYGAIPSDIHLQISLTRFAKRKMDHDNFVYALKWCRDAIGDFIWPNKKLAVRDDHDLVRWQYAQDIGPYSLMIEIVGYDSEW